MGLALAGIGLTLAARLRMGSDWRIGVDATEQTNLVTDGLFALVRLSHLAEAEPSGRSWQH